MVQFLKNSQHYYFLSHALVPLPTGNNFHFLGQSFITLKICIEYVPVNVFFKRLVR